MRTTAVLCVTVQAMLPVAASGDIDTATERARSGDFDAISEIRCAQEMAQTLGPCEARFARSDELAVAVVVTFPNGFERTLTFAEGAFLRGNATMSGVGTDTDWRLSDGIYHIRVDDQRFEVPQALVAGD